MFKRWWAWPMLGQVALIAMAGGGTSALAQDRTGENAVNEAEDAFGVSVGSERIGLYTDREVRGFSPVTAGNVRLEGLYINVEGGLSSRLVRGSTVRVGLASAGYPFPAPTGVVDYRLRQPGDDATLSVATGIGPFGGYEFDFDASVPVIEGRLALAGGASYRKRVALPGQINRFSNFALLAKWQPVDDVEVLSFVGYNPRRQTVEPTVFVAGPYLPPDIGFTFFGQPWAEQRRTQTSYGTMVTAQLTGRTSLRAGVFQSNGVTRENYSDLFRNTNPNGVADRTIVANPEQRQASTSGEARLTHAWAADRLSHSLHGMVRGRSSSSIFGGSSSVSLGTAQIGIYLPIAPPEFTFGPQSRDAVTQVTGGLGYDGRWAGVGELSLGLQRTRYRKDVMRPGGSPGGVVSSPWLFNGLAAAHISNRLVLYGGLTRGLEENGVAPNVAVNRDEPLPAALTSQREIGFRYAFRQDFRLVVGAFELRKPYYNLNSANVFTEAGSLRNRGMEFSIAGPVAEGLNLVLGGALMDPRVAGDAVELGRIGAIPAGQSRRILKLNLDYNPGFWEDFSVDAAVGYRGSVAASVRPFAETGEQLFVPARTVIDLGVRYRFGVSGIPALIRVQLQNVTNVGGWEPTSSGGFRIFEPRSLSANLAVDF